MSTGADISLTKRIPKKKPDDVDAHSQASEIPGINIRAFPGGVRGFGADQMKSRKTMSERFPAAAGLHITSTLRPASRLFGRPTTRRWEKLPCRISASDRDSRSDPITFLDRGLCRWLHPSKLPPWQ